MFTLKGKVLALEITDAGVAPLHGFDRRVYREEIASLAESFAPADQHIAVRHFGCYIGERVVVGSFPFVGFKEGDAVKAVVTNLDGQGVFAHAVMTVADGRIWLPPAARMGSRASLIALIKKAAKASLLVWLGVLIAMLPFMPRDGMLRAASLAALAILACGILGVLIIRRGSQDGLYADKILTMLGFLDPPRVDLTAFSAGPRDVYHLWPALEKYGAVKLPKAAAS
ncbi:MAG: hypothetical protein V4631_10945 [Pseudomonadota bacterium]